MMVESCTCSNPCGCCGIARVLRSMYATSDATITVYPENLTSLFYANGGKDIWHKQIETPADDPMSFLVNKQRRIARQQIDQRNDRIKTWEDKHKRFR